MNSLRGLYIAIASFVVLTIWLGLGLRWEFVSGWFGQAGGVFKHLRHAHSHAGYYGILYLALLAVIRCEGAFSLSKFGPLIYVASAASASVLFVFYGYNAATIVLSTIVLLSWVITALRLLRRRTAESWLDAAPWGVLIGAVLIPPVAVFTSRDPALAAALAHLFLTVMLLGVFIPAAWASLRFSRKTSVLLFYFFVLGASLQITFPSESGELGKLFLGGYALGVVVVSLRNMMRWYLRVYWLIFALGLASSLFLPEMQNYDARIAGVHFIVLGPVLTSYVSAFRTTASRLNRWLTPFYHVFLLAMVVAIFLGGRLPVSDPGAFIAWVSTVFVIVLTVLAIDGMVSIVRAVARKPATEVVVS